MPRVLGAVLRSLMKGGRCLLLRRLTDPEAGCWSFPDGKVDFLECLPPQLSEAVKHLYRNGAL